MRRRLLEGGPDERAAKVVVPRPTCRRVATRNAALRCPGGLAITVLAALLWTPLPTAAAPPQDSSDPEPVLGLDLYTPAVTSAAEPHLVELGRRLFHDRRLSRDTSLACASCHQPGRRFADGRATSPGVVGRSRGRNAPSLLNTAYREHLFWDGRAGSLEEAVLMPIRDQREMDLDPASLVARLDRDPRYVAAFASASDEGVTEGAIARALAAYVGTLRTGDAPVDRWLLEADSAALPDAARRGYRIFRTKAGCARCHGGPLFTDDAFHRTGVSPGGDPGRAAVTGVEEDLGRFRTPSLRDVALTAPYMHDGSLATLGEVIDFYARGGGRPGDGDPALRPFDLSPDERSALLAFLRALTGRVSDPGRARASGEG